MPRAKRHFLPGRGFIWHISHRCHKKEFLLKFKKDKLIWLAWLSRAKKAYGLRILNYVITSNHIHLLVHDNGTPGAISRSLHLAAGQTGQRFNRRKRRRGAFWQDRYHATAVEQGDHLVRCIVYIDLNMVRAGVVRHPMEWPFGGYLEIQSGKTKYCLIDKQDLMRLFGFQNLKELREAHQSWVEEALQAGRLSREERWTESVAVGSLEFVGIVKKELGDRGIGKQLVGDGRIYMLQETRSNYDTFSRGKK